MANLLPNAQERRHRIPSLPASVSWNEVWNGASRRDVIIFVIGPTGAGKSTFVRGVAPPDCPNIRFIGPHHGLESDTKTFIPVIISDYRHLSASSIEKLGGGRLIIVDTPGYDDTWMLPQELQIELGQCLQNIRNRRMDLGGIIYLYDFSQNRMPPKKFAEHLAHYEDLLPTRYNSIVLGLMGFTEGKDQLERKEQLETEYWKPYMAKGSHMMTFTGNPCTDQWEAFNHIIKFFKEEKRGKAAEKKVLSLLNAKKATRWQHKFKWLKNLFVFR